MIPSPAPPQERSTQARILKNVQANRRRRGITSNLPAASSVLVVAIAEHSKLGPVMGPKRGQCKPVAVSNPIWGDINGNGFEPNGDTLDALLPVVAARP